MNLGQRLGAVRYVERANHNGEALAKVPLHYIENHDHSRFLPRATDRAPPAVLDRIAGREGTHFEGFI